MFDITCFHMPWLMRFWFVPVATMHARPASAPNKRVSALLVIDMQYDFCPPTGSLAVGDALSALTVINKVRDKVSFDMCALTQDWHPANHCSFYENNKKNPQAALFQPLDLPGVGMQVNLQQFVTRPCPL